MFAKWTLAAVAGLLACACAEKPNPIQVQPRALVIANQTGKTWTNVEVWLNDHYRVTRSRMEAGERFAIPLDTFVAGFGQRFNAGRQAVTGVEVSATGEDGKPVTLTWGKGRRR